MLLVTTADTEKDLQGILTLQKENLAHRLPEDEINSQGFVTVDHTFEQLQKMNAIEKHIIAKDNDKVVGYILAMTENSKQDIPILLPMFQMFDETNYKGKMIANFNYLVVGQVCIAKAYRGRGVFDHCYAAYKKLYRGKYDFVITEIAVANTRSLHAHKRIGFEEVHRYTSPDSVEWAIVLWDWSEN